MWFTCTVSNVYRSSHQIIESSTYFLRALIVYFRTQQFLVHLFDIVNEDRKLGKYWYFYQDDIQRAVDDMKQTRLKSVRDEEEILHDSWTKKQSDAKSKLLKKLDAVSTINNYFAGLFRKTLQLFVLIMSSLIFWRRAIYVQIKGIVCLFQCFSNYAVDLSNIFCKQPIHWC